MYNIIIFSRCYIVPKTYSTGQQLSIFIKIRLIGRNNRRINLGTVGIDLLTEKDHDRLHLLRIT